MSIANINTEDLKTETELGATSITMRLIGSAETEAKTSLDAFLKAVHETALASKAGEVVVDLRRLEFMNSSCIKAFVSWIGAVQDVPPSGQYRMRFLSDTTKEWQGRSLTALACFAVDLIHIETS
jgi:hypothetical protein